MKQWLKDIDDAVSVMHAAIHVANTMADKMQDLVILAITYHDACEREFDEAHKVDKHDAWQAFDKAVRSIDGTKSIPSKE